MAYILTKETKNEKHKYKIKIYKAIDILFKHLTPSIERQGTDNKNKTDKEKAEIPEYYSLIDNLDVKLFLRFDRFIYIIYPCQNEEQIII